MANRAERRKSGVKEKPKTYTMTDSQLDKIKNDAQAEAKGEAFLMSLSIPVLVLHDKFGFDEDQQSTFINSCLTWMQCVHDGDATIQEIIETSEKLANMKFTKKRLWKGK